MWLPKIDPRVWQVLLGLALLVVTVLMWTPAQSLPSVNIWDKFQHLAVFAVLGLLAANAFPQTLLRNILLALAMYGFITELGQAFIPSRSFSVHDLIADIAGSCIVFFMPRSKK